MRKLKWIFFLGLFSNPFLILAASDITKKNYYPGKSLYFWIFSIMLFYSYYLYKNKTLCFPYLSKTFYKSSLINFAILYFTYIGINLIYDRNQIDTKEQTIQLNELMEKDSILYFQANNNFTSHIAHEAYINNHFLIPEYWKINGKIIKRDDYTIQNFYYDHLDFTDSAYVQMGYFGLGLYNYKIDSLKKSLYYFNKIAQNPIQY